MTVQQERKRIFEILAHATRLAREYHALTGRPLGITGEVAEHEAVRLLGLELAPARQPGYDALRRRPDGSVDHLQIKGRWLPANAGRSQRLGRIDLKHEWDAVLMVLLGPGYEVMEIYEADRAVIEAALSAPGSRARNERGALSVSRFKAIGRKVWSQG